VPPGLTWPTITFSGRMSIWLGKLEVQLIQLGRGHTKGDTVAWLPEQKILFSGDLVEFRRHAVRRRRLLQRLAADARQHRRAAAARAGARPRRGADHAEQVSAGLAGTRAFISDVYANVQAGVAAGKELNAVYKDTFAKLKPKYGHWVIFDHCMPFDVTRAYDEATQYRDPRIWTAERDIEMWKTLEG